MTKISAASAITSLADTDELGIASGGASKKISGSLLRRSVGRRDALAAADLGIIAEPYPLDLGSFASPGSGVLTGCPIYLYKGEVVTGVKVAANSTGSAVTLAKGALFSVDGATQYGVSASMHASLTTGLFAFPFTAAYTVLVSGVYIASVLYVGATAPSLVRGQVNVSNNASRGKSQSGRTDVPAAATWTSNANNFWVPAY